VISKDVKLKYVALLTINLLGLHTDTIVSMFPTVYAVNVSCKKIVTEAVDFCRPVSVSS
jgi:hypothetical protein